jgi:hypothetical protein
MQLPMRCVRRLLRLLNAEIVAINVVQRMRAQDVLQIALPYNTVKLKNGEEAAQRSSDIVLKLSTGAHFWLQCQCNEVSKIHNVGRYNN